MEGEKRRRNSIRLDGYDYSQPGAYFVTMCTQNKELFFEDSCLSKIAEECWLEIPKHFANVDTDVYVVMPNHLHGIIWISNESRTGVQLNAPTRSSPKFRGNFQDESKEKRFSRISPKRGTRGIVIRTFIGAVTRRAHTLDLDDFNWQRGSYDRIIRNREELDRIRNYINENPLKWELDEYHPSRLKTS